MDFLAFNSPLYYALIPLGVVALVVLFVVLIRYKSGLAQKLTEEYLRENGISATIIPGWMPPLRLWPSNRKGDLWCKIRMDEDGSEKWVRIGNSLLTGRSIDFLD